MSPFARPDLFWSTEQTAAKLSEPNVRIVDCRFSFEGDARNDYLAGHLPGAVHCNWSTDLSAPAPASGHPRWMLQGPEEFAKTMARLG
ncbi:MAG TPA: rhodanese-like domain-containing protein, partial [Candidatus Limnocylindria bacterium]|nr:rhodanese-like domain-containing protein [Candidatus Limnocylindria bacterium]